jgi:hypothetical protein
MVEQWVIRDTTTSIHLLGNEKPVEWISLKTGLEETNLEKQEKEGKPTKFF